MNFKLKTITFGILMAVATQTMQGMNQLQNINTNLIDAVNSRDIEAVKLLIKNKVDLNKADNDGRTALDWAACKGSTEIVKILVENGADLNEADKNGWTALDWAAYKGIRR